MESFSTIVEQLAELRIDPFVVMALVALPLVLIAWRMRAYPHPALVWLAVVPFLLSLVTTTIPQLFVVVLAIDIALGLLAMIDLFTLPAQGSFAAERTVGRIASLRQNHRVTLELMNYTRRAQYVTLCDDVPAEFDATPAEFNLRLAPSSRASHSRATVHYEINSRRRGAFTLRQIYFRVRSRLGLWQRMLNYKSESPVHVYPDMKQLGEYAMLARINRLSLLGVRRTRRVGQDNEFERLRDYTRDDNYKHIDWRSTARRNVLTVRDFQTNQSQRLIFMIDCGRMMTNPHDGLSLLDYSLNAMLMLSYVALRQGDSVGLLCFSDRVHAYVPPGGGMNQMNQLLHASFDRFPQLVESRYDQAFLYLSSRCRKRSLVMLMTNLIDEVNANAVERYLSTIVGRHLPVGVMLRDHRLFDAADQPRPQGSELFRAGAAAEILTWRHQVITDLEHRGVRAVDTFPEDMTARLINQYLEIKARHLL